MRSPNGYTALELLITLVLIMVLAFLAVPILSGVRSRAEATSVSRLLFVHLARARTAAVSIESPVVLCPRDSASLPEGESARCADRADWSDGWWLFADLDEDARLGPDDELIAVGQPLSEGATLAHGSMVSKRRMIRFNRFGRAWPNSSFVICPKAGIGRSNTAKDAARYGSRRVVVYYSGRIRVAAARPADCA